MKRRTIVSPPRARRRRWLADATPLTSLEVAGGGRRALPRAVARLAGPTCWLAPVLIGRWRDA